MFGLEGGGEGFQSQAIGPTFGEQVARSAMIAIIFSLLVISAYVAIRFEAKYAVPFAWESSPDDPLAIARSFMGEVVRDNKSHAALSGKVFAEYRDAQKPRATVVTCSAKVASEQQAMRPAWSAW